MQMESDRRLKMSENRWKKLLFLCLAIPFAVVPLWGCNIAGDRVSKKAEYGITGKEERQ